MKIICSRDIPAGPVKRNGKSTFVVVNSPAGKTYSGFSSEGKVLFNEKGSVHVGVDGNKRYCLTGGKLAMIPPLSGFIIVSETESTYHICRLSVRNHFTGSSFPSNGYTMPIYIIRANRSGSMPMKRLLHFFPSSLSI